MTYNTDIEIPEISVIADLVSSVKLPFSLTPQFKSMLQSGVGTQDLDVRWVSSLSWYFLTLFGLQPVYDLILGDDNGQFQSFSDTNSISRCISDE